MATLRAPSCPDHRLRLAARVGTALIALALAAAPGAGAQGVVITPQTVVLARGGRSATLEMVNQGATTATVTVTPVFGYPVTDTAGALDVRIIEAPPPEEPSAAGWTNVFPRAFSIAPGRQQTVRVLVRPPPQLPDGEYWARLAVVSRSIPAPSLGRDSAAGEPAPLEVEQMIAVFYRKGPLTTALAMDTPGVAVSAGRLRVRPVFERRGTAAYLGTCTITLRTADGREVRTLTRRLAVYRRLSPVYELELSGIPPGTYRVVVQASTDRDDLRPDQIVRSATVRDSATILVPR